MRMSNDDFTKNVLARGEVKYQERKKKIRGHVMRGAVCVLAAVIISPYAYRQALQRNESMTADNYVTMDMEMSESYEAADEAADEVCADDETNYEKGAAGNAKQDALREGALTTTAANNHDDVSGAMTGAKVQYRLGEDGKIVTETMPNSNSLSASVPTSSTAEQEVFVEMTDAELASYYGISEIPQEIGDLKLVTDRTKQFYYHACPQTGITFGDAAKTAVKDDTNLWAYAPEGEAAPVLFVYLNKAQDGGDSDIVYSENEGGARDAYFTCGNVSVWVEGSFMEQDEFEEMVEFLQTNLQ